MMKTAPTDGKHTWVDAVTWCWFACKWDAASP